MNFIIFKNIYFVQSVENQESISWHESELNLNLNIYVYTLH